MEYTKDIILNIKYEGDKEKESWTNSIKRNKFIYSIISITMFFMVFDIILVNNFVNLLSKI